MPKSRPGSGSPRRPRAGEGAPHNGAASPMTEDLARPRDTRNKMIAAVPSAAQKPAATESASQKPSAIPESMVVEFSARAPKAPKPRKDKPSGSPRFRIFIIDSGWNSVARRVLRHNFALIRRLHKEDPIFLLSRKKSLELIHRHRWLIGRDPVIAVHDLKAIGERGTTGFHGFHLHLGILRTPRQALTALQAFARFLRAHRQSANLEADIRSGLRREGILGAVEILLHKVPRVIGG
jgi:hypothetical protein